MGNTIKIGNSTGSNVISGSVNASTLTASGKSAEVTVFDTARQLLQKVPDAQERERIAQSIEVMQQAAGTPGFAKRYQEFVNSASGHLTVFSAVLGALASLAG